MPKHTKENIFLNAALAATHAGAFEWHIQDRTVHLSPNLEVLMGFPPGGFDGRMDTLLDILNPHDRERILHQVKTVAPDQVQIESEFRIGGPAGQPRWFSAHGEIARHPEGKVSAIIGIAQEIPPAVISERRMRAQQAALFELLTEERIDTLPFDEGLLRISQRAAQTLDVERVSIWTFSQDKQLLNCHVLYLNSRNQHSRCSSLRAADFPNYFSALSLSRALAVSYAPTDYRTRELADTYLKPLGITSMLEAAIRRKGETVGVVCHEQVGPSRDWTLDEQHFAASVADLVTLMLEGHERDQLLSHIEYQSTHDLLTGLPNRFWFRNQLKLRINQSDEPFALILADLDQFKEINDTLGHEPGDELLTELAKRLSALLPPGSTVARFGGDEFGIMLENPGDPRQVAAFAEKIRGVLHEPVTCNGMQLAVTASLGACLYPMHGKDPSGLMRRADVALYSAKNNNGFRLYDPSRDRHTPRRLSLMHDLISAVGNGELWAAYQPKLDMAGKRIMGLEVLARWTHPNFGEIAPEEFIPLAELSDLIRPLTLRMIRLACQQWRTWKDQGLDLYMAVNLSPRMLISSDWIGALFETLAETGMTADRLELEVTENAFIHEAELALGIMQTLSEKGVRFSLDDFGVGYSSLAHLSRLPIHALKIDKSFIQQMCQDKRLLAIVQSTIQLGDNLGIDVIAEGVETAQMFDQLRQLHCHQAQGFHLCPPLKAEEMPGFFARFKDI
jgi:diguanylate cyclase (GGDEF)-like protein